MASSEETIHRFYTAFQKKDYHTMQACYADETVFNDPVFKNLDGAQVRAMWEMLIKSGKDLVIEYRNVSATENIGQAYWTAFYTFSVTGRKVINQIRADFVLENGKIVKHTDTFNFYRWSSQAFGPTGVLLGWTPLLKNKVRKTARQNLEKFMQSNKK